MSQNNKYVVSYKVDWKSLSVKGIIDEKFFKISKNNLMYNENDNLCGDSKEQKIINEISREFISNNLSFNLDKIKNEEK